MGIRSPGLDVPVGVGVVEPAMLKNCPSSEACAPIMLSFGPPVQSRAAVVGGALSFCACYLEPSPSSGDRLTIRQFRSSPYDLFRISSPPPNFKPISSESSRKQRIKGWHKTLLSFLFEMRSYMP